MCSAKNRTPSTAAGTQKSGVTVSSMLPSTVAE
jgi:hypothetical protein